MSKFSWTASASIVILASAAGWLALTGTFPAMKARVAAQRKNVQLREHKSAIDSEIVSLKAEAEILKFDYQYNRRLERLMFRGAPEPGD